MIEVADLHVLYYRAVSVSETAIEVYGMIHHVFEQQQADWESLRIEEVNRYVVFSLLAYKLAFYRDVYQFQLVSNFFINLPCVAGMPFLLKFTLLNSILLT